MSCLQLPFRRASKKGGSGRIPRIRSIYRESSFYDLSRLVTAQNHEASDELDLKGGQSHACMRPAFTTVCSSLGSRDRDLRLFLARNWPLIPVSFQNNSHGGPWVCIMTAEFTLRLPYSLNNSCKHDCKVGHSHLMTSITSDLNSRLNYSPMSRTVLP